MIALDPIARALTLAFVTLGAAPIGAVLLLAIARLVGSDWSAFARLVRPLPAIGLLGALAMLAWWYRPVPPHLALWSHPLFVAGRAVAAVVALAWACARLGAGQGTTTAAVLLAIYAAVVTPIAADWLLPGNPGHGVSAVGMMLAVEQIGGACAMLIAFGMGDLRLQRDMGKLLVAAALGLGYLAFMDYLIVWFGNLPEHVGFYVVRGTPGDVVMATAALLFGLLVPIVALSLSSEGRASAWAGRGALIGLLLFNGWWLAAGWVVTAIVGLLSAAAAIWLGRRREEAAYG